MNSTDVQPRRIWWAMAEGCMSRHVLHARHYCKRDGNTNPDRQCSWDGCPLIRETRESGK